MSRTGEIFYFHLLQNEYGVKRSRHEQNPVFNPRISSRISRIFPIWNTFHFFFFLRLRLKLETQTFYFGSLFKETKEMDFLVRYPRARARIFPHVKTTNGGHAWWLQKLLCRIIKAHPHNAFIFTVSDYNTLKYFSSSLRSFLPWILEILANVLGNTI